MPSVSWISSIGLLVSIAAVDVAAGAEANGTQTYDGQDSLTVLSDDSSDAQECLDGLSWKFGRFSVTSSAVEKQAFQRYVSFPSPVPSGNAVNDTVWMQWHMARDAEGRPIHAPAIVVVHESGSRMTVGRMFAHSLRTKGIHTFMIQLPNYGKRREGNRKLDGANLVTTIRQAVADVRRAYDAVKALPHVDKNRIGLQGISLGGFVVASSAALDNCYSNTFIMLAGGDLYDVISNGEKDTAKVRQKLRQAGYTDEKLRSLLWHIEPTRLAHRLNPKTTWLYSAEYDRVVPMKNALILANAAKLDTPHHIKMAANHYTGILYYTFIVKHIATRIQQSDTSVDPSDSKP